MFDAVYLAMTKKLIDQKGRHVAVLITDGEDNSSDRSIEETLAHHSPGSKGYIMPRGAALLPVVD